MIAFTPSPKTLQMFWLILIHLVCISVDGTTIPPNATFELQDQEVFLGSNAVLEWKLPPSIISSIEIIKFGLVSRIGAYGERLEAIFVKIFPSGNVIWNYNPNSKIASYRNRTTVMRNVTAGLVISNVQLADSSEFYCLVKFSGSRNTMTDYVFLRVVDLQILKSTSSNVVSSWHNNKVQLLCHVKVARDTTTKFIWRNQAIGNSVSQFPQRDDQVTSVLTVHTYDDADFGPYVCVAMTPNTNQTHVVHIKRLHKPSAPGNVTRQRLLRPSANCSVQTSVTWMPPLDNGGSPVTQYDVQFKPFGEGWWEAETAVVSTPYIHMCRPRDQGRNGLEMRVMARNVVGQGEPSEVFIVTFWGEPTPPRNLAYRLVRNDGYPYIRVTWDYPYDDGGVSVNGYKVEYKATGAAWARAIQTGTFAKEVRLEKKSNLKEYEIRVIAYNGVGPSKPSEVLKAAFAEKPSRPLNVGISATALNTNHGPHIQIRWDSPLDNGGSPITEYMVEYKEEVQTNWSQGRYVEVDRNEFILTGIDRNMKYDIRVSARNSMGYGPPSKVVSVKYTEEVFSAQTRSCASYFTLNIACRLALAGAWAVLMLNTMTL
ncbi:Down syndrome cell adhesion molecule homolog [Nematostella vectensis]|uniref:Down syndrome cell adhesion molecule homolog n=1 Tax=Nematostella vectensis TaxID=45351 RepID=UPI002077166F|nr:Down syndrome cell adhesion molecule homolog [Nematostella vectensis]